MSLAWLSFENPVTYWWVFIVTVSLINIFLWFRAKIHSKNKMIKNSYHQWIHTLSGFYVFGCAFRSLLPRADVQKICLFDTWFSSVLVGRSVATIAELSFVAQWALLIYLYAKCLNHKIVFWISFFLVPVIFTAEIFSWYAVISTNYFGNMIEESLWAIAYTMIMVSLVMLIPRVSKSLKLSIYSAVIGCFLYVCFMSLIDVPMYFHRWQNDLSNEKVFFKFYEGITELNNRWVVTHNIVDWKDEILWMSLYFSFAVWVSLLLCYVPTENLKQKG